MTSGVGSIAVTDSVVDRRAADSANMPPPHPISRYRSFLPVLYASTSWHWRIKSCRRGFMRCSNLLEPCGSHHDDASALKCETSVSLTELCGDVGDAPGCAYRCGVVEICLVGNTSDVEQAGNLTVRLNAADRRLGGSSSNVVRRIGAIENSACFEEGDWKL